MEDLSRDFNPVEDRFKLNTKDAKRVLKDYDAASGKVGDFMTPLDPDYLLYFLLSNSEKFCNEVIFISEGRYKVELYILIL
jgi:hypothetical protein